MIGREKRRKRNHGIFFSHAFCSFFHHFTECINLLSINPYVLRFASGKARSTVSFRNVLETRYIFDKEKLVTEYIVDCIDELALPPRCSSENNDIEEKSSIKIILINLGINGFLKDKIYGFNKDILISKYIL